MDNLIPDDDEKVFYCKTCHSLLIIQDPSIPSEDWDGSYCGNCYSTDIGECTIEEWLEVEEQRRIQKEKIEWSK